MIPSRTIDYYDKNMERFIADTIHADMRVNYSHFLPGLPCPARILDFGCGSGRDTGYFKEQGYMVEAIDGSKELCRAASCYTGIKVRQMHFQDLRDREAYDGIWACASILHLSYRELAAVFPKLADALKPDGIVYSSFKYGTYEGERNGRYFTDMDEVKFKKLAEVTGVFELEDLWITSDVRAGRSEEKWLNGILRKR